MGIPGQDDALLYCSRYAGVTSKGQGWWSKVFVEETSGPRETQGVGRIDWSSAGNSARTSPLRAMFQRLRPQPAETLTPHFCNQLSVLIRIYSI